MKFLNGIFVNLYSLMVLTIVMSDWYYCANIDFGTKKFSYLPNNQLVFHMKLSTPINFDRKQFKNIWVYKNGFVTLGDSLEDELYPLVNRNGKLVNVPFGNLTKSNILASFILSNEVSSNSSIVRAREIPSTSFNCRAKMLSGAVVKLIQMSYPKYHIEPIKSLIEVEWKNLKPINKILQHNKKNSHRLLILSSARQSFFILHQYNISQTFYTLLPDTKVYFQSGIKSYNDIKYVIPLYEPAVDKGDPKLTSNIGPSTKNIWIGIAGDSSYNLDMGWNPDITVSRDKIDAAGKYVTVSLTKPSISKGCSAFSNKISARIARRLHKNIGKQNSDLTEGANVVADVIKSGEIEMEEEISTIGLDKQIKTEKQEKIKYTAIPTITTPTSTTSTSSDTTTATNSITSANKYKEVMFSGDIEIRKKRSTIDNKSNNNKSSSVTLGKRKQRSVSYNTENWYRRRESNGVCPVECKDSKVCKYGCCLCSSGSFHNPTGCIRSEQGFYFNYMSQFIMRDPFPDLSSRRTFMFNVRGVKPSAADASSTIETDNYLLIRTSRCHVTLTSQNGQQLSLVERKFLLLMFPVFHLPMTFYAATWKQDEVPNLSTFLGQNETIAGTFSVTVPNYGLVQLTLRLTRKEKGDVWNLEMDSIDQNRLQVLNLEKYSLDMNFNNSFGLKYLLSGTGNGDINVEFPDQYVIYSANGDPIKITWKGQLTFESKVNRKNCKLLTSNYGNAYFVKFSDRRYCISECDSTNKVCRIMCLSIAHVFNRIPEFCEGNYCELNKICVNTQKSYQCQCPPGGCSGISTLAPSTLPVTTTRNNPCSRCHENSNCQMRSQEMCCICKPNFIGSGILCLPKESEFDVTWSGTIRFEDWTLETSYTLNYKQNLIDGQLSKTILVEVGQLPFESSEQKSMINSLMTTSLIFDLPLIILAEPERVADDSANLFQLSNGIIEINSTIQLNFGDFVSYRLKISDNRDKYGRNTMDAVVKGLNQLSSPSMVERINRERQYEMVYRIEEMGNINFPNQLMNKMFNKKWSATGRLGGCGENRKPGLYKVKLNRVMCDSRCDKSFCQPICTVVPKLQGPLSNSCVSPCSTNGKCTAQGQCVCKTGYSGDGKICTKIIKQLECTKNEHCNDKYGRRMFCVDKRCQIQNPCINPNYYYVNGSCLPINAIKDCRVNIAFCQKNTEMCDTSNGKCICRSPEFIWSRSLNRCRLDCTICDMLSTECTETECKCRPGFKRANGAATVVNEYQKQFCRIPCTSDSDCPTNERCNESWQACQCPGYRLATGECVLNGNNQCSEGCHRKAQCNYGRCVCMPGYYGDGRSDCRANCSKCFDSRYCDLNNGCQCPPGYRGDGVSCSLYQCNLCPPNSNCVQRNDRPMTEFVCVCQESGRKVQPGEVCDEPNLITTTKPTTPVWDECYAGCHVRAQCVNKRCVCIPGYYGDGRNDCSANCSRCFNSHYCEKYNGCQCPPGYRGDGISCYKFQCDSCVPGSECIRQGMQFVCLCRNTGREPLPGAISCDNPQIITTTAAVTSTEAEQWNECNAGCHVRAQCVNRRCVCYPGYYGDGRNDCSANCSRCFNSHYCDPYNGCQCPPGYRGDGVNCFEFRCDSCPPNSQCSRRHNMVTQKAKFVCICKGSFQEVKTGETCNNIYTKKTTTILVVPDECSSGCHVRAQCVNRRCVCIPGYYGDGRNDCSANCSRCFNSLYCEKYNGCQCPPGYRGDGISCYKFQCDNCVQGSECIQQGMQFVCICRNTGRQPLPGAISCTNTGIITTKRTTINLGRMGIIPNGKEITVQEGGSAKLICWHQNPNIQLSWNRRSGRPFNGKIITTSNEDSKKGLTINNIRKYDADEYICTASSGQFVSMKIIVTSQVNNCDPRCHQNASCVNRQCVCNYDYYGDGYICAPKKKCLPKCDEIYKECDFKVGKCRCKSRFVLNQDFCQLDCRFEPSVCNSDARCDKSTGVCVCREGFKGTGLECWVAGSNCQTGEFNCTENSRCVYEPSMRHHVCVCNPGYVGGGKKKCDVKISCDDQSNCGPNAFCRHTLIEDHKGNLIQNGKCDCKHGFVKLNKNGYCEDVRQSKHFLWMSMGEALIKFEPLRNRSTIEYIDYTSTPGKILGLAVDCANQQLIWAGKSGMSIALSPLNNLSSAMSTPLIQYPVEGKVAGLSVDEQTGLLYYSDVHKLKIVALNVTSGRQHDILKELEFAPGALVVDSINRKLFWIVSNLRTPRIDVANLDGSKRQTQAILNRPAVAITINKESNQLCWMDATFPSIGIPTNQKNHKQRLLCQSLNQPRTAIIVQTTIKERPDQLTSGLAISRSMFYWGYRREKYIQYWNSESIQKTLIKPSCCGVGIRGLISITPQCEKKARPNICQSIQCNSGLCLPGDSGKVNCIS